MDNLANFLVVLGVLILLFSLSPVNHLRRRLPHSPCRTAWMFLSVLIVSFFVGYLLYAYLFWGETRQLSELLVPMVFFLGAIFVFVVCTFAAKTADDVTRLCHLEHENVTDPLLGIFNRRHMDRSLRQEAAKARRYGLDLSVMLIDVDFFKQVNDTYGHAVGDRVLQSLAQLIKGSVRDFDMVFRYGGEELLVLLPYTNAQGAQVLGDRLCHWVADRSLLCGPEDKGNEDIRVTISVGVSGLNPDLKDEAEMVARADAALYRAKDNGRNCVEVSDFVCDGALVQQNG